MKPLIIINLKTYEQGTGINALKLAKICASIIERKNAKIMLAVQATDIYRILKTSIPIIAQHVDMHEQGKHTGSVTAESVKEGGASGVLLNHSEKKLDFPTLKKTIERCKKARLFVIVCASTIEEAKRIARMKPFAIAYEVPELIATGKAISEFKATSVKKFSEKIKKINSKIILLCGAGISSGKDVRAALQLGCNGVLVSSAVVLAKNPASVILEMAK